MKKVAIAAVLVWTNALLACGGGGDDDDDVVVIDASVQQIDAAQTQCDPVTQEGCAEGQKCAELTVSAGPPVLSRTDCVANGTVPLGGACTFGVPGDETGFDDCASAPNQGAQCLDNVCRQICATDAATPTCSDGFSCARIADLFTDLTPPPGVCNPACDPVLQDCPVEGEACYLDPTNRQGTASCAGIPPEAVGKTQGQPCFGPDDSSCFLNGCDKGFHPQIPTFTVQPDKSPCIAYCRPVDTYIVDPDGDGVGDLVEGGRAIGFDDGDPDMDPTTSIDCSPQRLIATDQECRFFQAIGFSDLAFDYLPVAYGFCTDTGTGQASIELWGKCELDSEERLVRIFDEAGGGDAGNMAVSDFCTAAAAGQAGACAIGCVSDATFEDLMNAYCADPPVVPSPFCAQQSQRAIFMQNREERARRAMRLSGMNPTIDP